MTRLKQILAALPVCFLIGCAETESDSERPVEKHKPMSQRLNESGGYKQDEEGNWVPKSDKRSSYDSQRDSPYFKGKVEMDTYKTGDYAKKSWWGSKDYGKKGYDGNTDGSRFQKSASQEGQVSRAAGKSVRLEGPFKTNTLDRTSARETGVSGIDRPRDAAVQSQRGKYKAPSVIDWRAQRQMSVDESRGILGR